MNPPADTPTQIPGVAAPALSYAIRCQPQGRYALFQPLRQMLILLDGSTQNRLSMGFAPARLLELLLLKADVIVTREEIFAYAWPARVVSQNSLNQAISSLRELFGDEQQRQIIQTVPRHGYLFNSQFLAGEHELPALSEIADETLIVSELESVAMTPSPQINAADKRLPLRWPLALNCLLALMSLTLLGGLIWRADITLLLKPRLLVSEQQLGNQRVIFTAADEAKLATLEAEVADLQARMLTMADTPGTLLFNRMHDFYDVICIDQHEAVESLFIHNSQLGQVSDQLLQECLN